MGMELNFPLMILGFALLLHISLVNLDIGLGVFSPLLEWLSHKRGDKGLERVAKELTKYLLAIYGSACAMGIVVSVMLLVFYPEFVRLVGLVLFWPFTLAAVFIFVRVLTVPVYYFTWGRVKLETHLSIGFIMALTGFMVAAMFRVVFSFTNFPQGLTVTRQGLEVDVARVFMNPTLPPLLLHSCLGALSTTGFLVAGIYSYRLLKSLGEEENKKWFSKAVKIGVLTGLLFLFPQGVAGAWYLISLSDVSKTMFYAVTGVLLQINKVALPPNLVWLFTAKMLMVMYLATAGILSIHFHNGNKGVDKPQAYLSLLLAPFSIATLAIGEAINEVAHLPYIVVPIIKMQDAANPFIKVNLDFFIASIAALTAVTLLILKTMSLSLKEEQI